MNSMRMNRKSPEYRRLTAPGRAPVPILLLCAALLLPVGCRRSPAEPKGSVVDRPDARPNVLLISLCSVRADHLGCYGYVRDTTPAMDAFAEQGVLFEQAVTQWPKTAPSFCAMHTGLFPHTTGIMRITPFQRLDDSFVTLAERFQEAGYQTAAFVSSPALNKTLNLTQGFESYVETFRQAGAFEQTRAAASGWMKLNGDRPFFLWAHFNCAHVPYWPPADLHEMFVGDEHYDASRFVRLNLPENDLPVPADHPYAEQIRRGDLGGVLPLFALKARPTEWDYYVAEYDAAIRSADRFIGALLEGLGPMGLRDRTIVVLVSDHGESLGEHNHYFEHGRLPYDACQRVPFMIRAPGMLPAGVRVKSPVAVMDLAPTLVELAGLEADSRFEGRSLVPVIKENEPRGDVFFSSGYQLDFLTGIRTGRWKLIHASNEMDRQIMTGREFELYDVIADPSEVHDLSAAEVDVVRELKERLSRWRAPWWEQAIRRTHLNRDGRATPTIDRQALEQLESLGYVKSTPGKSGDKQKPDTRE